MTIVWFPRDALNKMLQVCLAHHFPFITNRLYYFNGFIIIVLHMILIHIDIGLSNLKLINYHLIEDDNYL